MNMPQSEDKPNITVSYVLTIKYKESGIAEILPVKYRKCPTHLSYNTFPAPLYIHTVGFTLPSPSKSTRDNHSS